MATSQARYLEGLTDKQALFCGDVLKRIFLEGAREIVVEKPVEKDALVRLVMSFDDADKMEMVFGAFHPELQYQIAVGLSGAEGGKYFKKLYVSHRSFYKVLKQVLDRKVDRMGPILVKRAKVSHVVLQKEIDQILTGIISPKTSVAQCVEASSHLGEHYDAEALDHILSGLIVSFRKMKLSMNDEASFLTYLKFYFFVAPFLKLFSELSKGMAGILDVTILAMSKLPSVSWVFKILSQLPEEIVVLLVSQLKKHGELRQFEKRTVYTKLAEAIRDHLDLPEASTLRPLLISLI
jgi:hypothetical protein